jgi:perosamine synthetase
MKVINKAASRFALVVDESDHLLGIVTDGDIRRGMIKGHSVNDPVKAVMNASPVIAHTGQGTEEIACLLSEKIRQVPIVGNDGTIKDVFLAKDVPVANPYIGDEEAKAVYEVMRSGWVSMGDKVQEFEEAFAKYVGATHAIATNNGTSALHLALMTAGIEEGDEVLIPDITFISTANVVLYERAKPILVECDPGTYNMSLEDAERRLTRKTRAMILVDMNGLPVDYDRALAFARKHGLEVIADSAESLGAVYKGQKVGAIAPIHIFSFFPNKNITTGEGGMITTESAKRATLLRQLRNQGQDYRYHHIHLGYNYRMIDLLAVFGLEQLKRIERILSEKERIVARYNKAFENDPDIKPPVVPEYVDRHAWYMYAVSLRDGLNRDSIVADLKARGVDTRLSFPPIHIQPYYQGKYGYTPQSYPMSLKAWNQLIDLPIWVGLSEKEQGYVVESLKDAVRSSKDKRDPAVP